MRRAPTFETHSRRGPAQHRNVAGQRAAFEKQIAAFQTHRETGGQIAVRTRQVETQRVGLRRRRFKVDIDNGDFRLVAGAFLRDPVIGAVRSQ